jgi:hypothetical protein
MTIVRAIAFTLALAVVGIAAGCGYTTGSTLDERFQTVYVAPFENNSGEYDLQAPLTNALRRKFINDTRLEVVQRGDADIVLEGVILGYELRGVTFDDDDNVTQFLTVVTAGITAYDGITGELVWIEPKLSGESSYYTRAAGQSSDRLRGNAEVFLPTVRSFATEEENRGASEALEQLASDVFYRTVDPW